MSVNGCAINFQVDILGDRSSSVFVINLAKQPVQFYNDPLPAHGAAGHSQSFNIEEASNILGMDRLSYDEPGNGSISSSSLSGTILTVQFANAPGSSSTPPNPTFHLTGRLLIGSN